MNNLVLSEKACGTFFGSHGTQFLIINLCAIQFIARTCSFLEDLFAQSFYWSLSRGNFQMSMSVMLMITR